MTIGMAIREARGDDFTQAAVAEATGIDQGDLSKFERDVRTPSIEQVAMIEDACERPRGFVYRRTGHVTGELPVPVVALGDDARLDLTTRRALIAAYAAAVEDA